MVLFDLHADTPTRLFYENRSFTDRALHFSANDLPAFQKVHQVFAVFSRPSLTDDAAYAAFFAIRERLLHEIAPYTGQLVPILAVEDARLLGNEAARIACLAKAGVSLITLVWRGETVIGGAYDTRIGLSAFGKAALPELFRYRILPDVSHASEALFWEVAETAAAHTARFLATHSNSRAVRDHKRNLTDGQFKALRAAGGLCGLSLCCEHLTDKKTAALSDVIAHIEHWCALGGEDTLALGTDFDGIEQLPEGIGSCRDLYRLKNELLKLGYKEDLTDKLFYKNAEAFFGK